MSAPDSSAIQSMPAFFSLRTGRGQSVVKSPASNDLQVADDSDAAILFQMPSVSAASDDAVLLQTLGGRLQVRAELSTGVVLQDGPAEQSPFVRLAIGDGFALGTPDRKNWLSVSSDGRLVLAELPAPGESETFASSQEYLQQHGPSCCGPSSSVPSTVLWDDQGHRDIVLQGIQCMRNPWSPTEESTEFIRMLDSDPRSQQDLLEGLREADYVAAFNDNLFFTSHFYDPDTKMNYWGQYGLGPNPGETALERGSRFFKDSVDTYAGLQDGTLSSAESPFEILGIAAHYLTDLTQPMHAANITNFYGDHPPFPLIDKRHSRFEDYGEGVARSGMLFENYPRLTVEEMSIEGFTSIDVLYHEVAKSSKQVWLDYVKPIYEGKRYLEAWGPEAHDALMRSTHMAPVAVAKFLSYWMRQILNLPQHSPR